MAMPSKSLAIAGQSHYNGIKTHRPGAQGVAKVLFLVLAQLSHASAAPLKQFFGLMKAEEPDPEDASMWLYLGIAAVLVLLGGAFAGLTIALMGQDGVYLQVIATSGEGKEQQHAKKVYDLLQRGKHWVLVTLLLSNVIVNETLPIILDRSLGGGWPAVLGSTVLIVIFGEVIPQSVCVRYGLSIGAYMAPPVLGLMYLLAPIAWPTAKLLDKLLGKDHGTVYKKSGLKTLVTLHRTLGTSPTERLNQDEVTIISAVLDLKDKAVGDIMTPMDDVFTMSSDTVLDEKTMDLILSAGYSRIPIYVPGDEHNFCGMLLVKILITYDPEDCKKVGEFALATLPETKPDTSCLDIVNFFQEGKSHMVLVSTTPGENTGALGVVTLEDVIEELIGEEIIDESDVYIDVHKAIRRMAPAPKARAQGHLAGHPGTALVHEPEEYLIDLTEGAPIAKKTTNGDARSESPATVFGTSPKTTFMKRGDSSGDKNVAVRGNLNDMREHLKHLGPSNLASRPKTTRYNTVKIKTASGSSASRQDSITNHESPIIELPYEDDVHGGEGEGLLSSGGRDAKDGVQALQQGYGSIPRSQSSKLRENQHNGASLVVDKAHESISPERRPTSRHDSQNSNKSSDTLGSLHSGGYSSGHRKKGVARSGSITENIIEADGVRKVVLETNSSSENDQDDPKSGKKTSPGFLTMLDGQSESHEDRDAPRSEEVKKKRRRTRKKKGAKSGEE